MSSKLSRFVKSAVYPNQCLLLICAGMEDLESTERPQVDIRLNAPRPRSDARLGSPSFFRMVLVTPPPVVVQVCGDRRVDP